MKMKDLLLKKNVVYVCPGTKKIAGTDTGKLAIEVHVTKKMPLKDLKAEDVIPKSCEGLVTDVIGDTEEIRALRRSPDRPMFGGSSVGHPEVTAGTGTPMWFPGNPIDLFIYSNNHVIANCNDCHIGDQTWKPGRIDGGNSSLTIGHLWRWVPLHFTDEESTCQIAQAYRWVGRNIAELLGSNDTIHIRSNKVNRVDAAVSKALDQKDLSPEILGIGIPNGFNYNISEGQKVKKSGRTSEVTEGEVTALRCAANVDYGNGRTGMFENQIITTAIAEPGDSGSVVLDKDKQIVGALFAGSSQMTLVNHIKDIIEELGLA